MPGGEWIRELLESVGWGFGATHMALFDLDLSCARCHGRRYVGHPALPLPCPDCRPPIGIG
jgi:hypothetical protein